ncbi:MAG: hypothetical protein RLZZ450_5627 [Pseudomonadota bacterium]
MHAMVRWTGDSWLLKDLGSTNGTTLDGRPLAANEHALLKPDARVTFGHVEQAWRLLDDGPPLVMALPEDGGAEVLAIDGLLALPSAEQPALTVHRDERGIWVADVDGELSVVTDQERLSVSQRRYTLCLPQELVGTAALRPFGGRHVAELAITFRTSTDLEHIELDVQIDRNRKRFAARTHNEMLLVLARAYQRDAAAELAPEDRGWMYLDELCQSAAVDRERLNIDVYRLRRQFAELGLLDPANIIERRAKTKQLRIGTVHIDEQRV